MTQNLSNTESWARKSTARIKTKLKFQRAKNTGAIIAFVSQYPNNGRLVGVREDSKHQKKICLVDKDIVGNILVDTLYDCEIIPMTPRNGCVPGYIVVSAEPTQFRAKVEIEYVYRKTYRVSVTFGNMKVIYDPFRGERESVRDLSECRKFLERRVDIKNLMDALEEFDASSMVISEKLAEDFADCEEKDSKKWKKGHR